MTQCKLKLQVEDLREKKKNVKEILLELKKKKIHIMKKSLQVFLCVKYWVNESALWSCN